MVRVRLKGALEHTRLGYNAKRSHLRTHTTRSTNVVMFDPVTAEDGLTYDRAAIESWLEDNSTSPIVREGQGFLAMGKALEPNREQGRAGSRAA